MGARSSAHSPQLWQPQFDGPFTYMKRIVPFIIILAVLGIALVSAWYFTRSSPASTTASTTVAGTQQPQPPSGTAPQAAANQPAVNTVNTANKGVPGAEPAHVLGPANAPAK